MLPNTVLSIAHGHQARGGGNAQQKVVNWFTKMSSNKTKAELYDTDVLLVGHFHHHFGVEVDHRLVLCSTAYDLSDNNGLANKVVDQRYTVLLRS